MAAVEGPGGSGRELPGIVQVGQPVLRQVRSLAMCLTQGLSSRIVHAARATDTHAARGCAL